MGRAVEHPNLSGILRESDFHSGALEESQGGRRSSVPEAKGARNTKEIIMSVMGNSGKSMTGKQIH